MIPRVIVAFFLVNSLLSLRVMWACANRANEELSDAEVTEARIEFVKQQILKKLRLSKRPDVAVPMNSLPAPVAQGATLPLDPENLPDLDDFYGRTEQKIVFPVEGECLTAGRYPFACLQFDLPLDVRPEEVSVVELWFYKESDPLDEYNQTFVISEAAHWDSERQFRKTRPVAIQQTDVRAGWLRVQLDWAVRVWLDTAQRRHTLHVACRTCQSRKSPLSFHEKRRPFLVLSTMYAGKQRSERTLECGHSPSECCREQLYVDFEKIGWSDWIYEPQGYNAYFCRGSCASISAVTLGGSFHSNIIRKLYYSVSGERQSEFKLCCAPTKFSSLQLIYADSNNTLTTKILPNMVVESCGCM